MRIAQEEVFGPVLAVIPFKDEEEAIAIGNDVVYGLAAGVWTKNMRRALKMAEKLQAGTVWINTYRAVSYLSPFGGYKRSGLGRESGQEMIKEYLQVKSVWISTATTCRIRSFNDRVVSSRWLVVVEVVGTATATSHNERGDMDQELGFVGVGRMGGPMAKRLLDAGYSLSVFDTNAEAVKALVARGAKSAASAEAVASAADIVLMSLPTPPIVQAVSLGSILRGTGSRR